MGIFIYIFSNIFRTLVTFLSVDKSLYILSVLFNWYFSQFTLTLSHNHITTYLHVTYYIIIIIMYIIQIINYFSPCRSIITLNMVSNGIITQFFFDFNVHCSILFFIIVALYHSFIFCPKPQRQPLPHPCLCSRW